MRLLPTLLQPGWHSAALRLMLAALLLVPVALTGSHSVLQAAVPAMTRVFEALVPELQVVHLGPVRKSQQQLVRVEVVLVRTLRGNGRVIESGSQRTAVAYTPALNGLLTPLLAALTVAAWPVRRGSREVLVRAALCPTLLLWCWLETPLTLASILWRPMADAIAPDRLSPLAAAEYFLAGGGRVSAALIVAAGVVIVARLLCRVDAGRTLAAPGLVYGNTARSHANCDKTMKGLRRKMR